MSDDDWDEPPALEEMKGSELERGRNAQASYHRQPLDHSSVDTFAELHRAWHPHQSLLSDEQRTESLLDRLDRLTYATHGHTFLQGPDFKKQAHAMTQYALHAPTSRERIEGDVLPVLAQLSAEAEEVRTATRFAPLLDRATRVVRRWVYPPSDRTEVQEAVKALIDTVQRTMDAFPATSLLRVRSPEEDQYWTAIDGLTSAAGLALVDRTGSDAPASMIQVGYDVAMETTDDTDLARRLQRDQALLVTLPSVVSALEQRLTWGEPITKEDLIDRLARISHIELTSLVPDIHHPLFLRIHIAIEPYVAVWFLEPLAHRIRVRAALGAPTHATVIHPVVL